METNVNMNPYASGGRLATSLKHTAYRTQVRLPKYNGTVNLFGALSDRDGARVLRRTAHSLRRAEHARLAERHFRLSHQHRLRWDRALDEAALAHLGRPFWIGDYRVSAVGLDEFDESFKRRARLHAHAYTRHELAARAHRYAAAHFRRFN
jgi:hypothetical protein